MKAGLGKSFSKFSNSNRGDTSAILSHFQRLVKLDIDRRTARSRKRRRPCRLIYRRGSGGLARLYGQGLNISFTQNPALIGGLRVKVGSDVYDGSVQARLAALQKAFNNDFDCESVLPISNSNKYEHTITGN